MGAFILKILRSKDRTDIGKVISESGKTFTIMQAARREFNISKPVEEGYDRSKHTFGTIF
jgi:hypothetical protein